MSKRKDRKNALISTIPVTDVEDKPALKALVKEHDSLTAQMDKLWQARQKVLRDMRHDFGPGPFKIGQRLVIVDNNGNTFFLSRLKEN